MQAGDGRCADIFKGDHLAAITRRHLKKVRLNLQQASAGVDGGVDDNEFNHRVVGAGGIAIGAGI